MKKPDKTRMRFFTILLLLYSFTIFSQSNLPDYSPDMFRKDTAVISTYAVNLPVDKKAELYALASYWGIMAGSNNRPDTISKQSYYYYNKKKEIQRFKKEYLDVKNKLTDWKVYYFFDLNQDSKLDIIETSRYSEDTTELWYPGLLDNHIRFFLSTTSNYYYILYLPGRITSLTRIKNEFHFMTISHSCCDEGDVTRISKFHIPTNSSKIVCDIGFWANGYNPEVSYNSYNRYAYFPKHFNTTKYYLLQEDLSINSGVYGSHGRMEIKFPKNEIARIISETENYYFIELKVLKDEDGYVYEKLYMIRWLKKDYFEKMAIRLD